ncbi:MAG: ATPase, T2SS/T4P/T4SS family [Chloroflexia bacterium]
MSRPAYTTRRLGIRPQDVLGPALLQARSRRWQQEVPAALLEELRRHLLEAVPAELLHPLAEPVRRERAVRKAIRDWLERNQVALLSQGGESLVAYLYGEVAGFGPLQPLLADPEVTEIKLIDPRTVLVERAGRRMCRSVCFPGGEEEVRRLAVRLAELGGRGVSRKEPVAQVQLADGSRIILMPFEEIPQIFIRRRAPAAFSLETLLSYGTLNEEVGDYLRRTARARAFFLVAGPSGAGKTAFLEMLLSLFPPQAHIVVVQQGTEIRREGVHPLITLLEGSDDPAAPNSLEAVAMRTLKMGVISLVIGETKGPEAAAILHSISAGIRGGGTTIHTDDAEEALRRLTRLARSARFSDLFVGATPAELRQAVARSVHVVVLLEQSPQSGRRYVRQVAEVEVVEEGWRLHPILVGQARPGPEGEEVVWERRGESCPRLQALQAAYAEGEDEAAQARLEAERRAEVERLLASAAAMVRSGDWGTAEAVLVEALALAPEDEEGRRLLEKVRAGQKAKQEERERRAGRLREEAREAAGRGNLARLEWLVEEAVQSHLDEVAGEVEQFLWKAREEHLAVEDLLALALEQMPESPERAGKLLQAVLRRRPDHPEAAFYLELAREDGRSRPAGGETEG